MVAIIQHIDQYRDITPYYNIKDPSWPDIKSVDDFFELPKHIIDECNNVFGFYPVALSDKNPHAPRWVMREIFKSWFTDKEFSPLSKMDFLHACPNAYRFNLSKIYDYESTLREIQNIQQFFDLKMDASYFTVDLHAQFLAKVPFLGTDVLCQNLLQAIEHDHNLAIDLNVFCEAYLNFMLEEQYHVPMPVNQQDYFPDTKSVSDYIRKQSTGRGLSRERA